MTEHGAHPALRISQGLTAFNSLIGSAVAWLTLLMVLVTTYVVVLRYGFGKGSIATQESVTYMHCAVFMLGSAMTLARGGHVRVDIFYQHWGARRKALVDLLGALFLLLPFATFLVLSSTGYVFQSWRIGEGSTEPDGLHLVYLLKSMIPVAGVMLGLQAVADILRNALLLAGFGVSSDSPMPSEEII